MKHVLSWLCKTLLAQRDLPFLDLEMWFVEVHVTSMLVVWIPNKEIIIF